jgi:hypothetical protein
MANNTGVFFNVNDNDGIPLVGVSTNGNVSLTPFYGNTGIGITNPVSSLDVDGPIISRSGAFVVSTFSSGGSEASWANPISVSNVDHIWHNDGLPGVGNTWGLGGEWNFVSDSTYKADGNSWIRAGGFANTTQMLGASYPLQISGNSYISGSLGIGTTNPTTKLDVFGDVNISGILTASKVASGIPQNTKTSAYTLQKSDVGKYISISSGGVTVPSGIFSEGDVISVYNNSASNQTITQGISVTMYISGTSVTGNRTLSQRGLSTILCVGSNTFIIGGAGLL